MRLIWILSSLLFSGNVFITNSSDITSEIVPFVDFLTKQGFRPAVSNYLFTQKSLKSPFHISLTALSLISQTDLCDNPMRCMDINKWKDSYLKDVSEYHSYNLIVHCSISIVILSHKLCEVLIDNHSRLTNCDFVLNIPMSNVLCLFLFEAFILQFSFFGAVSV